MKTKKVNFKHDTPKHQKNKKKLKSSTRPNKTKSKKATKRKVLTADIRQQMRQIVKHKYTQLSSTNTFGGDTFGPFKTVFDYTIHKYRNGSLGIVLSKTRSEELRYNIDSKELEILYGGPSRNKMLSLKITDEDIKTIKKNADKIAKNYHKALLKLTKLKETDFKNDYDKEEIIDFLLRNKLIKRDNTNFSNNRNDYYKDLKKQLKVNIKVLVDEFIEKIKTNKKDEKYIAIVGGGPTALVLAYKILEHDASMNIIIYEKRDEYVRKQNILVPDTGGIHQLGHIVRQLFDYKKYCMVKAPPNDLEGKCVMPSQQNFRSRFKYNTRHISIPIKDFENGFKDYLKNKVTFIKKDIKNIKDIDDRCYAIFGCDGSKSVVRNNILKSKEITDDYESYGLILNHTAKNNKDHIIEIITDNKKGEKRPIIRNIGSSNYSLGQNRYRFFRGPDDNFYIGLQLTYAEYKESEKAKKYYELPRATKKIFENYFQLLDVKPKKGLEDAAVSSFKIKHTYYDKYADIINGKGVYIVGDAVSQAHYFTASGLSRAYDIINKLGLHNLSLLNTVKVAQDYNVFVQTIINTYYDSTRDGYLRSETTDRLCKQLSKDDWDDIKKRMSKTITSTSHQTRERIVENKVLKLNWFDDKEELCKLFSQFIIDNYPHKASRKRAIKSHRTTIGF